MEKLLPLIPMPVREEAYSHTQQTYDEVVEEAYVEKVVEDVFARFDGFAMGISVGLVCGLIGFLSIMATLLNENLAKDLAAFSATWPGISASWTGAVNGFFQMGITGFLLGYVIAFFRNKWMCLYAARVKKQAETKENNGLLDKV